MSERLKISQFAFEGFYTSFESVKISPTPHPRIFIARGSPQNGRYFSRSSIQASVGMRKASEDVKKMMPVWKAMSEPVWGQNY